MLESPSMPNSIRTRGAAGIAVLVISLFAAACSGGSSDPLIRHLSTPAGLSASPTTVSMGPEDTAAVNASEPGYSGTYSATTSNSNVATVAPNGPAQFVVSGVAPGTCTVTISDTMNHTAQVSVSIQTTVIGGQ